VKQSDLGGYEENAREAKDTDIQDKSQLPIKPRHRDGKHQFPSVNQQIEKHQGV
jgi:hypothetical protein